MAQMKVIAGFTVLLPTDDDERGRILAAPRLETLREKRIGFLNNTKDNVDRLFAGIQAQMEGAYALGKVVHRAKAHFSTRAPREMLEELHRECDAVIVAAGA
jgi:hypothetical protein